MPLYSIVVPFHNNRKSLSECLHALERQTLAKDSLDIIFVDDGSNDGSDQIVSQFDNVRLFRQENKGPAAARNKGAREAKGEIVLFTDADCAPDPSWAKALVQCLDDSAISGAKGVYRTEQKKITPRFVQLEYLQKYQYMKKFKEIDFIDTYSAAYRKKIFEDNLFDENYPKASVEDQEFSFRLVKKGHRFRFCPDACVKHYHVDSVWGYFKKKFKIGFWKAKILFSQRERIKGDTHTPLSLRFQILLSPFLIFFLGMPLLIQENASLLWMAEGLVCCLFLFSCYPLFLQSFRSDWKIFPLVPVYLIVRAFGLGLGLFFGLIFFFRRS